MAFSIDKFRSSFGQFEPAAPTNYEISIIRQPKLMLVNGGTLMDDNNVENVFKYRCIACSIPGKMMNVSERLTYGPNRRIVTNSAYQDVTFSLIVSDDMKEKQYFTSWHDSIVNNAVSDNVYTHDVEYYNNYVGTVSIVQFKKDGNPSLAVILEEAYPISVEEIPLGWEMNNDFIRINVTMAYRIWQTIKY